MRTLLLTVAACAAMIVGGIALATVSGPARSLVALIGFIGFAGLVMYSGFRAWRNDPGLYYSPRKARQE